MRAFFFYKARRTSLLDEITGAGGIVLWQFPRGWWWWDTEWLSCGFRLNWMDIMLSSAWFGKPQGVTEQVATCESEKWNCLYWNRFCHYKPSGDTSMCKVHPKWTPRCCFISKWDEIQYREQWYWQWPWNVSTGFASLPSFFFFFQFLRSNLCRVIRREIFIFGIKSATRLAVFDLMLLMNVLYVSNLDW